MGVTIVLATVRAGGEPADRHRLRLRRPTDPVQLRWPSGDVAAGAPGRPTVGARVESPRQARPPPLPASPAGAGGPGDRSASSWCWRSSGTRRPRSSRTSGSGSPTQPPGELPGTRWAPMPSVATCWRGRSSVGVSRSSSPSSRCSSPGHRDDCRRDLRASPAARWTDHADARRRHRPELPDDPAAARGRVHGRCRASVTLMLMIGVVTVGPGRADHPRPGADAARGDLHRGGARRSASRDGAMIRSHILPNIVAPARGLRDVRLVATVIVFEASLSYLGLGVQQPTPSWGNLVQQTRVDHGARAIGLAMGAGRLHRSC